MKIICLLKEVGTLPIITQGKAPPPIIFDIISVNLDLEQALAHEIQKADPLQTCHLVRF
jgi:hypothetical protein